MTDQPAPLTPRAITTICDATLGTMSSWAKLTRMETAVALDAPPTLHAPTAPFELWTAVSA